MDFLTFNQATEAKKMGMPYPPDKNNTWFGMLFTSEHPDYQSAFVGTGQWELFKQHCIDSGVWRATPVELLRLLPVRWALYCEETSPIGDLWVCLNLDQPIYDVFEGVFEKFHGKEPVDAVYNAWKYLKENNRV